MTDSEFWRDLGVKFQALQPSGVIGSYLTASWTSGVWNQTGAQWLLSASDPQVKEEFVSLAEEAAAKYGGTTLIQNADERWKLGGEAALFFWLDVLKRESGKYKSDHGPVRNADGSGAQGERGKIMRVSEASADYCGKLARRGAGPASSELPLPSFKEVGRGAIRMRQPARHEIEKFADGAFAIAREGILTTYAEKQNQVLSQVRLTGNIGGYLPALAKWAAERVREEILALAEAYVEAFTTFGVPSDAKAEKSLQAASQQIAAGSASGIRGQFDLMSKRTQKHMSDQVGYIDREIEKSRLSALKKGVFRLEQQRIKFKDSESPLQPRSPATDRTGGAETMTSSRASEGKPEPASSVLAPPSGDKRKRVRRNPKYEGIDDALREIAKSRPKSHEEVFRALDGRSKLPDAEPFKTAGGWIAGFKRDKTRARAWLSKAWSRLNLPSFPRGPK